MREGCLAAVSHLQQQEPSKPGCNASSLNGQLVVDLPYSAQQLSALLGILYEHRLEVRPVSLHPANACWPTDLHTDRRRGRGSTIVSRQAYYMGTPQCMQALHTEGEVWPANPGAVCLHRASTHMTC
jgi:hypothetical protein